MNRPSSRRSLRASRTRRADSGLATLAQEQSEAAAIVQRARDDAATRRQSVLDELAAREKAAEELTELFSERDRDLGERRQTDDAWRDRLNARQSSIDAVVQETRQIQEKTTAIVEQRAALERDVATRTVLERMQTDLDSEHPGRVAATSEILLGDAIATARSLLTEAMQRQDASHADTAPRATPVPLEGLEETERAALMEKLQEVSTRTGAELTFDDERQQAVLRTMDPVAREISRQVALEVTDRRLQVADVPPLLVRTGSALQRRIKELGERTLWEAKLEGRPELAELMGTLHYRFSYGQNALLHCQETGYLCAALAGELRMDPTVAHYAGLLHDIGKAVDHDVEGSHAIIGGELLAIFGVETGIVHAVKAHHFDEEPSTNLAMLTICADALSASRPGARRDTLTTYLARLEQLQQIATRHQGVERAFPMQAGREVRVSVVPEAVSDDAVPQLCAEIAHEIEAEMNYPGMIKVTVIRETVATATG